MVRAGKPSVREVCPCSGFTDQVTPSVIYDHKRSVRGRPLIGFDWAGKYGEASYPAELEEGVTEYCEAGDVGIVEKKHISIISD